MGKLSQGCVSNALLALPVLALLGLAALVIHIVQLKGAIGAFLLADVFAGGFALLAAWLTTKSTPYIRGILLLAILFFVIARFGQYTLL